MDITQTIEEGKKQQLSDTTPEPRRSKKFAGVQDPQDYADAVSAYSELSAGHTLYPGSHFKNLAGYLQLPYEPQAPTLVPKKSSPKATKDYKFVSLYDLNPAVASTQRVKHIHQSSEFESQMSDLFTHAAHGRLLFMRGHPSPEWLVAIGAKCEVDPEYFLRHLDFRLGRPDFFPLPSLPSSSTSMFRLRVTTIGGSRSEPGEDTTQQDLDSLRVQNVRAMHTYKEKLRNHSNSKLGDSIVRDCFIYDTQHFTIEQDISIYVKKIGGSWIALVWLDNGNDLSESFASLLTSPLRAQSWQIIFAPVIQHKCNIALKPRSRLVNENSPGKIVQSASLLHLDYGRNLDRHIAASDAFYALHEIFSFVSFSENQFLNMIESKLAQELDQSVLLQQKNPTLSNLLYNQQVLEKHIFRIRENIATIESRALGYWPKSAHGTAKSKADTAAESLLQDYKYLLFRAQTLCEQCHRGMQIVMSNANIKESREAISQAKGLAKLTRLAFVFIPLSFVTSFFGMNLSQFGTGILSIWAWFAVSCPIFILSIIFMKFEIAAIRLWS